MQYVSDLYASVCPEVKMLKAFGRVSLGAGRASTQTFVLPGEAFSFIGRNNRPTIEAGEFSIQVANLNATLVVV